MRHWSLWLFSGALSLRLISIAASMLWYDEAFTATVAQLPFLNMLTANSGDVHPPLWYLIEWIIAHTIGASELTLRFPSALFGAGSTVALYKLVSKLVGEKEARWSSGLLAVMPGQLYYSQEARMYSMLTFLVLFGANAVHDRKWLRAGISLVLMVATHNLGAVYVGILGLWAAWRSRGAALKILIPVGLAYVPQGIVALEQFKKVGEGYWIAPSGNIGGALYYLFYTTFFVRLPDVFQIHGIAVALAVTILSVFALKDKLKALAPLIALAFGPSAVLSITSLLWHPVQLDRALLPAGAAVVGLWGACLPSLPKWGKWALASVAVPMLVTSVVFYYLDPNEQRAKSDPMVDIITAQWEPGDAIYHTHMDSLISFDWYLPDKPAFILPESGDLTQSLTDDTKFAMGIKQRESLPQGLRAMGYKRLWLVSARTVVSSDLQLRMQEIFIQSYPTIEHWSIVNNEFVTIDLFLLDLHYGMAIQN